MRGFGRCVAIDWTGAKAPFRSGIAVAVAEPGTSAPHLVEPPSGRPWTRGGVVAWLLAESARARLLVGLDFAFSLPFARAAAYFAGEATAFELWALIDSVCEGEEDYFGGSFAEDPRFAAGFWVRGKKPPGFELPQRATELACRAAGHGAPESPYKLLGPKQVGKGSLAGMRVLHHLRTRHGDRFAIWPFEPHDDGRSVLAEIYPRLFLRAAGHGNAKIRDAEALAAALRALGSDAPKAVGRLDDHDTDALVAAAGLRSLAREEAPFVTARTDREARVREGFILGVPLPGGGRGAW